MSSSTRRKMLAAQEDIANRILELAQRKNMTVYQTVNDILIQALRVEEKGLLLTQVVDEREMLEHAKNSGFSFTVEQLYYDAMEIAYKENPEKITALWREKGHWYGKFFDLKFDDPLQSLEEALKLLTLGPPEFRLENNGKKISLYCVGEKYTTGYAELFAVFLEEIFKALDYSVSEKEIKKGLIKLLLKR